MKNVVGYLVLLGLWVCVLGQAVRPTPETKTVATIRQCYFSIGQNKSGESGAIEFLAAAERKGIGLSSAVNALRLNLDLTAQDLTNGTRLLREHSPVLDGWREPLLVFWVTNLPSRVSPSLLAEHRTVLIWSKGPNRTNDWGHGDDIFILREK